MDSYITFPTFTTQFLKCGFQFVIDDTCAALWKIPILQTTWSGKEYGTETSIEVTLHKFFISITSIEFFLLAHKKRNSLINKIFDK